jgi:hypothetical protein
MEIGGTSCGRIELECSGGYKKTGEISTIELFSSRRKYKKREKEKERERGINERNLIF